MHIISSAMHCYTRTHFMDFLGIFADMDGVEACAAACVSDIRKLKINGLFERSAGEVPIPGAGGELSGENQGMSLSPPLGSESNMSKHLMIPYRGVRCPLTLEK